MLKISGQYLVDMHLYNAPPWSHPWRTAFFILPIVVFTVYSLQFFRNVNLGVTVALPKKGFPLLLIFPGNLSKSKKYRLAHYDSPILVFLMGLLLFTAAEILIIMLFKEASYTFRQY